MMARYKHLIQLYSWGFDECIARSGKEYEPKRVEFPYELEIVDIACTEYMVLALDSTGSMWTWGAYRDQRGDRMLLPGLEKSLLPVEIKTLTDVSSVSAGESHAACTTRSGGAYTWGAGEYGQLGRPATSLRKKGDLLPTPVMFPPNVIIQSVFAVGFQTFWVTNEGVYGCGNNGYGELGLGHVNAMVYPVPINFFKGNNIIKIVGGMHHALFLSEDGRVWTTGSLV
jgi:regulator of chromosome condensation